MVWKITDEIFGPMAGEVRLTINGINMQAPQEQSLLLTIRQQGIDIPTLCHHPDLAAEGQCRLCVVEIGEYPRTRVVNSCTYPTEGGLVGQTHSEGGCPISMSHRSPAKRVTTPFLEKSAACIGCGSCAFICPTNVIPYTEKDGVRTIWGRDFELQPCVKCGNYIEPKAHLEHWAKITGDPVESFFSGRNAGKRGPTILHN